MERAISARRRFVGLSTAAILWLAAGAAGADEAGRDSVVMVAVRSGGDLPRRTADAVASQLADLPIDLAVEWVDEISGDLRVQVDRARTLARTRRASAIFWADLSAPEHVFLFISEPEGGRILVRAIRSEGEDTEARLETIALIVRSSVKAMIEGGRIGVEAPPPPEAPAEEPAGPAKERPDLLDFSVSYVLELYSSEKLDLHGIGLRLSVRAHDWLRVAAGYRVQFPLTVDADLVSVEVGHHPIELGLAGRWRFDPWRLDAWALLVVDPVTVEASPLAAGVVPSDPGTRWISMLSPGVSFGIEAGRVVSLYIGVSCDIVLNSDVYVVDVGGDARTALAPWRARPIIHLGASFGVV